MARELSVIQQEMIDNLTANGIAVSGSRTSLRRLWTYVISFCIWVHEQLFDAHKDELNAIIDAQKSHTLKWYQSVALEFQYGQNLIPETGKYANTGMDEAEIEAQKIVEVASVTEIDGKLRIKVARLVDGELEPLTEQQLLSFSTYIDNKKDAGVKIVKDSLPPDALKLEIDIFYNALVLSSTGARIDGTSETPVPDAISLFLKNLPFNGEYANTRLVDVMQKIDGVVLPVIKTSQAKYGLYPFSVIDERYIPDAGYLRVAEADLTINYRPYV